MNVGLISHLLLVGSSDLVGGGRIGHEVAGLRNPLEPWSRAARKWRENEEMKRKWRENEEMKRKWRENEEMKRD